MGVRSKTGELWEREQAYRRRLYMSIPISAAIVLFLFLSSDRVSIADLEKHAGWQGELRVLPEITIVPDDDPHTSIERQRKLTTMTSLDIDLFENPDVNERRLENVERPQEEEILDLAENDIYDVRTMASRREASYSDMYVIVKMVEPEYPPRELEEGIEGNVTVELLVNEQGFVEAVSVLSAIGPKSFEESSLDALKQFVFQPPVEDGKPVAMWIRFLVKFRIFG